MESALDVLSRAASIVETRSGEDQECLLKSPAAPQHEGVLDQRESPCRELPTRISKLGRAKERLELTQLLHFNREDASKHSRRCAGTQTQICSISQDQCKNGDLPVESRPSYDGIHHQNFSSLLWQSTDLHQHQQQYQLQTQNNQQHPMFQASNATYNNVALNDSPLNLSRTSCESACGQFTQNSSRTSYVSTCGESTQNLSQTSSVSMCGTSVENVSQTSLVSVCGDSVQSRPSVITCALAASNGQRESSSINNGTCSSFQKSVWSGDACDSTIEEHFRRSLGTRYPEYLVKQGAPSPSLSPSHGEPSPPATETLPLLPASSSTSPSTAAPASVSSSTAASPRPDSSPYNVSITGCVDDHFAKSLGDRTWFALKSKDDQKNLTSGSVDDHFAKALGGDTWLKIKAEREGFPGRPQPLSSPPMFYPVPRTQPSGSTPTQHNSSLLST